MTFKTVVAKPTWKQFSKYQSLLIILLMSSALSSAQNNVELTNSFDVTKTTTFHWDSPLNYPNVESILGVSPTPNLTTFSDKYLSVADESTVNSRQNKSVSDNIIGGTVKGPLAVKLEWLKAVQTDDGQVFAVWQAGAEVENLGYRVWREADGRRESLTREMVAGNALRFGLKTNLEAGGVYQVCDEMSAQKRVSHAGYWLEAIDLNGQSEWFGPVSVELVDDETKSLLSKSDSPTLEKLNETMQQASGELQTESIVSEPINVATKKLKAGVEQSAVGSINVFAEDDKALKLEVAQAGWYRVSGAQLVGLGMNPAESANWKIFADGVEQAIKVNADSSLEFYGRGVDYLQTDGHVYWLVTNFNGLGKRIPMATSGSTTPGTEGWTRVKVEKHERFVRVNTILNGDTENWFGAIVFGTQTTQTLNLRDISSETKEVGLITIKVQGVTLGEHHIEVNLNGISLGTMDFNAMEIGTLKRKISLDELVDGDNQLTMRTSAASGDVSVIERIDIKYPRRLQALNGKIEAAIGQNEVRILKGFTTETVLVTDLTDEANIKEMSLLAESAGDGSFNLTLPSANANRVVLAETARSYLSPRKMERNVASNLRSSQNDADFVIVAPSTLQSAIAPLAAARQAQGLRVKIVNPTDIFDEYSNGERSANALKQFFQNAKTTWTTAPRYVLLVGDASSDPRNYAGRGGETVDLIPGKFVDSWDIEVSSDEALVDFDNDGLGEMVIGRLPVQTPAQVTKIVTKILNATPLTVAQANQRGTLMVSDDPIGYDFQGANEGMRVDLPSGMAFASINRGEGTAAEVKARIITGINANPFLVGYFGHGNIGVWTGGGILRNTDAPQMNGTTPSLMVLLTCLNGVYTETNESMVEAMLKANGGAYGIWASADTNFADEQEFMAHVFYQNVFSGQSLGDAAHNAKASVPGIHVRRAYHLFGDPTQSVIVDQAITQ